MDLIACGDALWISCGTWIGFWNGAIGAFVAAIIGGLVALTVVRLTNRQQATHAEETRQIAALADLLGANEQFSQTYHSSLDGVSRGVVPIRSAIARLQMSQGMTRELGTKLSGWAWSIGTLGLISKSASGVGYREAQPLSLLIARHTSNLNKELSIWPTRTPAERMASLAQVDELIKALDADVVKHGTAVKEHTKDWIGRPERAQEWPDPEPPAK